MNDWLSRLTDITIGAAKKAGLPDKVAQGFDGESWLWIWRDYVGEKGDERIAETRFRVQPDAFGEGLETEVSGNAWMQESREISWARSYSVRYLELKALGSSNMPEPFKNQLEDNLRLAWDGAHESAQRLEYIRSRRTEAIKKLRDITKK